MPVVLDSFLDDTDSLDEGLRVFDYGIQYALDLIWGTSQH